MRQSRLTGFKIHSVINVDTVGYRPNGVLSDGKAVLAISGIKDKLKAVYRILLNAVFGLTRHHESIKVVGHERNRPLIDRVSSAMEESGVVVSRRYDPGCG